MEFPVWGVVVIWIIMVAGWLCFAVTLGSNRCLKLKYQHEYLRKDTIQSEYLFHKGTWYIVKRKLVQQKPK